MQTSEVEIGALYYIPHGIRTIWNRPERDWSKHHETQIIEIGETIPQELFMILEVFQSKANLMKARILTTGGICGWINLAYTGIVKATADNIPLTSPEPCDRVET